MKKYIQEKLGKKKKNEFKRGKNKLNLAIRTEKLRNSNVKHYI